MTTRTRAVLPWIFVVATILICLPPAMEAQLNRVSGNQITGGTAKPTLLQTGAGAVGGPGWSFAADTDTGAFNSTANVLSIALGGNDYVDFIGGQIRMAANQIVGWNATSDNAAGTVFDLQLGRNSAGQLNLSDADGTPDLNFNVSGSPTPSSCGDGALATGSSNTSGRIVGTTQTGCTLTFSVAFPGNSADCFVQNITGTRAGETATASTTALVVAGLTAGDDFMYFCAGR